MNTISGLQERIERRSTYIALYEKLLLEQEDGSSWSEHASEMLEMLEMLRVDQAVDEGLLRALCGDVFSPVENIGRN